MEVQNFCSNYFHETLCFANIAKINEPSHDKTNKMICGPREDSDQPGDLPSLIRVFAVRMKKPWILSYPMSAQRRLLSDWVDTHFVCFIMLWLKLLMKLNRFTVYFIWASSRENLSSGFRPGKTQISLLRNTNYLES